MENLFKRFVVSYLGLTVTFWLLSYAMTENGFDRPRNPAWRLISGINHFFTWGLIFTVSLVAIGFVVVSISEATKRKQEAEIARIKSIERGIREAEARAQYEREEAEKKEIERLKKIQWKKECDEREEKEWQRKQKRSAKEALREALDDF